MVDLTWSDIVGLVSQTHNTVLVVNAGFEDTTLIGTLESEIEDMEKEEYEGIEAKETRSNRLAPDLDEEFLGLTLEEVALVEMKLALDDAVNAQRETSHLSQAELAAHMKSSQSRVANRGG